MGLLLPPPELELLLSFLLDAADDEENIDEVFLDTEPVPMDRSDGCRSLLEDVEEDDDEELPVKLSRELDRSRSRSLELEWCLEE